MPSDGRERQRKRKTRWRWQQRTAKAPWAGRAGLSAVSFKGEIYVMGGSRR